MVEPPPKVMDADGIIPVGIILGIGAIMAPALVPPVGLHDEGPDRVFR